MLNKLFTACLKEFRLSNCGFDHAPPEEFVRSQWQSRTKSGIYLVYRWAVALIFVSAVVNSMIAASEKDFALYFIYLTNWGIMTCMITGIFGAVLVTTWYFHPQYAVQVNQSNEMPLTFKIYWAFHNSTLIVSIVITIVYWTILHNDTIPVDATNVMTHAMNSVLMFLDVLIVAYPIRLLHVLHPICVGVLYGSFTVVYYLAGGVNVTGCHYVYNVLDWSKPGAATITMFGTLILALFSHVIMFLVYKLRFQMHTRCCRKTMILPTSQQASPGSRISMVLGHSNGYNNSAFSGSTDKL